MLQPSAFHHPTKTGQPFIPQPTQKIAQRVILNDHETMCFVTGDEAGVVVYERDEEAQAFGDLPVGNPASVVHDPAETDRSMRRPVDTAYNDVLDRYLYTSGITPHSIVRFEQDGSGEYRVVINPCLLFTGQLIGRCFPFIGCIQDVFSEEVLSAKELEKKGRVK